MASATNGTAKAVSPAGDRPILGALDSVKADTPLQNVP